MRPWVKILHDNLSSEEAEYLEFCELIAFVNKTGKFPRFNIAFKHVEPPKERIGGDRCVYTHGIDEVVYIGQGTKSRAQNYASRRDEHRMFLCTLDPSIPSKHNAPTTKLRPKRHTGLITVLEKAEPEEVEDSPRTLGKEHYRRGVAGWATSLARTASELQTWYDSLDETHPIWDDDDQENPNPFLKSDRRHYLWGFSHTSGDYLYDIWHYCGWLESAYSSGDVSFKTVAYEAQCAVDDVICFFDCLFKRVPPRLMDYPLPDNWAGYDLDINDTATTYSDQMIHMDLLWGDLVEYSHLCLQDLESADETDDDIANRHKTLRSRWADIVTLSQAAA